MPNDKTESERDDNWQIGIELIKRVGLMEFCRKSLIAGVMIGLAGLVYAKLGGYLGALCFSGGLFYVVSRALPLYTGRIAYLDKTGKEYGLMLFFNICGAGLMGLLSHAALPIETVQTIALTKLQLSITALLFRGFFCGMWMYYAVDGFQRRADSLSIFPLVWGVFVFVACGFEHCIADAYYFSTVNTDLNLIVKLLAVILGNTLGAIFLRKLS